MKAEAFFIIRRLKDGMYYHETEPNGQVWFVSDLKSAYKFYGRDIALAKIRQLQNWLKRPKFEIIRGQHLTQ